MFPLLARSACARTGLGVGVGVRRLAPLSRLSTQAKRTVPKTSLLRAHILPRRSLADTPSPLRSSSSLTSSSSSPTSTAATAAPAPPPTAFDRFIPTWAAGLKPYLYLLRWDKPIGALLLYWPGAWAITMASTATHAPLSTPLWYLALFGVGAMVMRGAGCIINDMWDSKVDAKVERTATRPLAAGTVTHTAATVFLASQLTLGLGVLTQLNMYSIALGAASLPLIFVYPFMKRVTYYPQIVLGLCFEWGALLGWSAVAGSVDWSVAGPLYAGCVAYCVAYDTIYAHQDKRDDVTAGVKSTALAWGDKSKPIIGTLYTGFVCALTYAGYAMGAGPLYYAISCVGGAAHLAWQVITVDLDSRADCWKKFTSNGYIAGPLIWAGMFADYLAQVIF
ncbi:4-hydroxybenzoate polyprenyl transferase [Cutaneotrichosporon oleaginosum]|uniref:4-hydroxybenzoate polyprenyltransferase, mitochondrial n=1 Tax=Cutaneotrichosporon oleaginosum TaxID=879819 RepID=A0A0J0XY35_9TREE|nr:4-hydroxybenzoate polyprenyl transferase [Cutaneotrichosporon oleaginosum]KLT45956.1 4-hydroxybenzoate polyprenyl transferase [Cutaneotrichosporon oleaginosum]